jgi:hypothetical protein
LTNSPPAAQAVVAGTRFFTLTWLMDQTELDFTPEAVAAGYAALAYEDTADRERQVITSWLVEAVKDTGLVPDIDGWEPFERGQILESISETGAATDDFLAAFIDTAGPRAGARLARVLARAGLRRSATFVIDTLIEEYPADFTVIHETAEVAIGLGMADFRHEASGSDYAEFFFDRMREIGLFEFEDLIRAGEFALRCRRQDRAGELCDLAATCVEGCGGLIRVAFLRRRVLGSDGSRMDQETLNYLDLAMRDASDPLDHVMIAYEYLRLGQFAQARELIERSGLLGDRGEASPVEDIALLRCSDALTGEEIALAARRAAERLHSGRRLGTLGPRFDLFRNRLVDQLSHAGVAPAVLDLDHGWNVASLARDERPTAWKSFQRRLTGLLERPETAFEKAADLLKSPEFAGSFGLRIAVLTDLGKQLAAARQAYRECTPQSLAGSIPLTLSIDHGDGRRAVQLTDLWRAYLTRDDGDEDAARQLDRFFTTERDLVAQWSQQRQEALEPMRHSAGELERIQRVVMDLLLPPGAAAEPHPVLADLYRHIQEDLDALREQRIGTDLDSPLADPEGSKAL